jgi:hypothetical protein
VGSAFWLVFFFFWVIIASVVVEDKIRAVTSQVGSTNSVTHKDLQGSRRSSYNYSRLLTEHELMFKGGGEDCLSATGV